MAFRYPADSQHLGALVVRDPAAASERLQVLFRKHRSRAAVAEALGVNARTLARWIERVVQAGFDDPRDASGVPRRRPAA